ncbi:hypothetical protein DT23_11890 [Thioclava indica]|uniref:Uncharacterized protein n=1 Tax=Thioclava indica TaxID=1353528 RepID=A0A074JZC3_9RHOB|nr:hypothetical protein DT23_11890 [Thioclava indica]
MRERARSGDGSAPIARLSCIDGKKDAAKQIQMESKQ